MGTFVIVPNEETLLSTIKVVKPILKTINIKGANTSETVRPRYVNI